ncbi:MAG: hypothetical protein M3Q14_01630 [bacterium]|nr:hypothetical protein [bacterium]
MGTQSHEQPELFIPDSDRPDILTVNPEALAPDSLAARAIARMPEAAEREAAVQKRAAEQARAIDLRFEHDDNNPNKTPDPDDLVAIRRKFTARASQPTIKQAKANARRHERETRKLRWGK